MTQLHQRKRSDASLSDEYETPDYLIAELAQQYGIFPKLDVACIPSNQKCKYSLTDGLNEEWDHGDVWCNPPHSLTKEFVLKADEQWEKHGINIMMIIPANSVTTNYFADVIDHVEYYPIKGRITFLVNGEITPHPARNGYFVIIWRSCLEENNQV